jgi:hypothetical protein
LSPRALEEVNFVDMTELGRNPARIIPAWRDFVAAQGDSGRPVRGIGEPIWPERHPQELLECQLHEALLNVAVDPELPFWLVCPYDAEQLGADVVDEAYRSHPVIVEADAYHGSAAYAGRAHVDSLFETELSDSAGSVQSVPYTRSDVRRLRGYLRLELHVAGLAADAVEDLTDVVLRLVVSSLHRGSENGTVKVWSSRDAVVCEVADGSRMHDPLAGRRAPSEEDHDALWLANQTCDLVQLRSTLTGTAVRLHTWK